MPSRLIPESPSWLLVKGRTKEALEQLQRVAQCNKADLQVCFLHGLFRRFFSVNFKQLSRPMRLHGSLRKRARWKRTNPLLQKRLFCRCSKLRIFASTPFFVLSSGELSSIPWWHATFDEKHLSFPSLNVNTLTAWWASCATTATSKTLPIWARAMSTRATSLEHLLRSLAGQL